jgi:hypothetical protein
MNKEDIVSITPEDIELYNRARAINLPAIVISMYGDRIKILLAEERAKSQGQIETLHAMYELASKQRDVLMDEQRAQIAAMRGRLQ